MPEEKVWTNAEDFLKELESVIDEDDTRHDFDDLNRIMDTLEQDIFID
jgi:hypothetical protein